MHNKTAPRHLILLATDASNLGNLLLIPGQCKREEDCEWLAWDIIAYIVETLSFQKSTAATTTSGSEAAIAHRFGGRTDARSPPGEVSLHNL